VQGQLVPEERLEAVLANHAAGIEVSKPGVAPVSAEELLEAFRLQQATGLPVG